MSQERSEVCELAGKAQGHQVLSRLELLVRGVLADLACVLARDVVVVLEVGHEALEAGVLRVHPGAQGDLRGLRGFVGVGDAREVGDLPGHGLAVEPLGVALFQDLQGAVAEDLDVVGKELPVQGPGRLVRGDGRHHADDVVLVQEVGDEPDPANVDVPVRLGEAQTLGKVHADDVPVQDLGPEPSPLELHVHAVGVGALA